MEFIVQQIKRFLLFLVQQKISKGYCRRTEDFLHTLFLKHEEETSEKIQGDVFLFN